MQLQNRRRSSRFRVSTPAVVWSAWEAGWGNRPQDDALKVVLVESISGNGLSFLNESAVDAGTEIWIRFRIGSKVCQIKGIVRYAVSRPMGSGRAGYLCGVEFVACCQTAHAQNVLAGYLTVEKPSRTARA